MGEDRLIEVEVPGARATVAPLGAELKEWTVNNRPLLWQPDPAVWPETAPLLFPVVGWTKNHQVRVGGQTFPLGLHGFARHRPFRVGEQTADRVRLILESDTETRALYPFDFVFSAEYRLSGDAIETVLTVENCGKATMPYACGLHPGFRWPFAGGKPEDYGVRFSAEEDPHVPRIAPGGLIARSGRQLPFQGRTLRLMPELFDNDALCFLYAASKSVRFEAPNGAAILVEMRDFAHIGIWCRPGHGYLCIEEWTGFSDPEDFAGELFVKPSMIVLAPGGRRTHSARFTYQAR